MNARRVWKWIKVLLSAFASLIVILIVIYNLFGTDMFVYQRIETEGEYLGFSIGMTKEETRSVIETRYAQEQEIFFNGYNEQRNHRKLNISDLHHYRNWAVVFGHYGDNIRLSFDPESERLVRISKYRNFWGT